MRRILPILAVAAQFLSATAVAVSQVGGGSIKNPVQGFSITAPSEYDARANPDDSFTLICPFCGIGRLGGVVSFGQVIRVQLFAQAFQELADPAMDRSEFARAFDELGWSRQSSADACVERRAKKARGAWNEVLAWGGGKGVIVYGEAQPSTVATIDAMADALALDPGACAWP